MAVGKGVLLTGLRVGVGEGLAVVVVVNAFVVVIGAWAEVWLVVWPVAATGMINS